MILGPRRPNNTVLVTVAAGIILPGTVQAILNVMIYRDLLIVLIVLLIILVIILLILLIILLILLIGDAFTTGNPFFLTNLVGVNIGRGFGALKGLINPLLIGTAEETSP